MTMKLCMAVLQGLNYVRTKQISNQINMSVPKVVLTLKSPVCINCITQEKLCSFFLNTPLNSVFILQTVHAKKINAMDKGAARYFNPCENILLKLTACTTLSNIFQDPHQPQV